MNELKNIVIINDFDYVQGGASKVAIETANLLSDKYNVYFFSGDSSSESTLNNNVIKICTNQGECLKNKNKLIGSLNGIYNFKAKNMLKKILKKLNNNETIIHVHGWTKCLSSSIFDMCWKMKFKVVLTLHDYFTACPNGGYFNYKKNEICELNPLSLKCLKCNCDSRSYIFKAYRIVRQFFQNKIIRLNDRLTDVITISEFSEKILRKTLNPKTKIHRVYNPIDLDNTAKKVDYIKNKYYLYVGRISKEKGVDLFCEAITNTGQKGIVVGDGPEKEMLERKYSKIKFVGWKNASVVKKYMKNSKALIIPSRWYEAAPLTPLEALQYGIPIITSSCNATMDYLNTKNGESFNIKNNELEVIIMNFSKKYKPSLKIKCNYYKDILYTYNKILNGGK